MHHVESLRDIQTILHGYRSAQVLIACTSLGVFEHLTGGPSTVAQLAEATSTHAGNLERLLDAAVAMGLLQKTDEEYANARIARACLARDGASFIGNMVRREGVLYAQWGRLAETVRAGSPPRDVSGTNQGAEAVEQYQLALLDAARIAGPIVAKSLPIPSGRPATVLDVGGGLGGYSMALVRQYPHVHATVFELPQVAKLTRNMVTGWQLSESITVREGDFRSDALGSGFDLILLFGVLPCVAVEGRRKLLDKARDALKPGGFLALRAHPVYPSHEDHGLSTVRALQELLASSCGVQSPRSSEIESWLPAMGFESPSTVELPTWLKCVLLLARRRM